MPRLPRLAARVLGIALLASLAVAPALAESGPAAPAEDFESCERRMESAPEERDSSRCFYLVARQGGMWTEAARRLDEHHSNEPDNPWPLFYLGNVEWSGKQPEVAERYRAAALLLAERGDRAGEVDALLNLALFLRLRGKLDASEEALARALAAATRLDDPDLRARVRIEQARHALTLGHDLGNIYRLLREVEESLFPGGSYEQQRDCLDSLGQVTYQLGRFREAQVYRRRQLELALAERDLYTEATARYALAAGSTRLELPTDDYRQRVRHLAEEAADAAERAGHRVLIARTHGLAADLATGSQARRHAETCLAASVELGLTDLERDCLASLARHLAGESPEQARQLVDRALALDVEPGDPWSLIYSWSSLATVMRRTHPPDEVLATIRRVIEAVEALHEAQLFESERVRLVSQWSEVYYRASGLLLDSAVLLTDDPAIEEAFAWIERMRAKTFLEARAAEPTLPRDDDVSRPELGVVLGEKAAIYRRLLDPRLSGAARQQATERLESLERREADLRFRLAERQQPRRSPPTSAEVLVSLSDIASELAGNEALLSFQIALWTDLYGRFGGGSWLLATTREGTRRYRLPDRLELEPAVELLLGLPDPESSEGALARLYHQLLADALGDLPVDVGRLIVVPDGILHRLPFALLREHTGGEPLAARFELVQIPSATAWHAWRTTAPEPAPHPLLALADPELPTTTVDEPQANRALGLDLRPRLGRLPHARREVRRAARRLGDGSRVLEGESASERALVESEPGSFAIIHFAAHALVDDLRPERSAVVLAPGVTSEDGLLQPQEIVELELDGRVVVLSACSTADGGVLEGAGIMSLARAFFQAGAHAVVGSLWPVEDAATADLFDVFYLELAAGSNLSGALAEAQRSRRRDGAAATDWSGFVVFGHGAMIPFPGGRPAPPTWPWAVLLLAVAAVVIGSWRYVSRWHSGG